MSDFDELFSNLRSDSVEALARDSKIKIVTEYDEPSLKAGEYWYSVEENTLYVGSGVTEDTILYITNFLKRKVSVNYIPAPRIKVSHLLEIPTITKTVTYCARLAPRLKVSNTVNLMNILTVNAEANKTMLHKYSFSNNVVLSSITHRTEVQNVK